MNDHVAEDNRRPPRTTRSSRPRRWQPGTGGPGSTRPSRPTPLLPRVPPRPRPASVRYGVPGRRPSRCPCRPGPRCGPDPRVREPQPLDGRLLSKGAVILRPTSIGTAGSW